MYAVRATESERHSACCVNILSLLNLFWISCNATFNLITSVPLSYLLWGGAGCSVGSTVASQQEGPGFDSLLGQSLSVFGVCMFSPCLHGFSPCASGQMLLPHHQNIFIYRRSPISSLDHRTVQKSGIGPGVPVSGCPLHLSDGWNAENTFHYVVLSIIECDSRLLLLLQENSVTVNDTE